MDAAVGIHHTLFSVAVHPGGAKVMEVDFEQRRRVLIAKHELDVAKPSCLKSRAYNLLRGPDQLAHT